MEKQLPIKLFDFPSETSLNFQKQLGKKKVFNSG